MEPAEFDVDGHAQSHDPQARARALQSLLIEKELLTVEQIDSIISLYEEEIGPLNGAQVVARAWTDPDFRSWLLDDGMAAAETVVDVDGDAMELSVVANSPTEHHLVVCTLCSCYPWAMLGLPPTWYKTPEYRSQAVKNPRTLLQEEFDLALPEDIEIHVHDSTSEVRYMVLPQRPAGTEAVSESGLVEYVTRDSMIGVERLGGRTTDE